jgi:hypothetical protein
MIDLKRVSPEIRVIERFEEDFEAGIKAIKELMRWE